MGIFEIVDETKTILPVKVPDVDVYSALQCIAFDSTSMQREVAADYIAGVMDLYRDAGGREDILERVIREHFGEITEEGVVQLRRQLKPNLPWQKPKMVPWALYEIVAEEVRRELAKQKGFEEKVDPTVFPFLVGVYSLVAHPAVVFSSSFLSIEGLIENVNRFGKRLNTVTTMETVEQGKYDPQTQLMKATLRREQNEEALRALENVIRKQADTKTEDIVRAICARDLATVCGALVGGSLLKGQRLRYIEVSGDPNGTADITIYYPRGYRTAMQTGRIVDAIGLATTARRSESEWREGYLTKSLDDAIAPLNAVASKTLSRRIEALTRAEEAEIRIRRLRELAREASHHVKNPASALLGISRSLLVPDEEVIFREIKEEERREVHLQIVKEVGGASEYRIEGIRGQETQRRLTARYEAYRTRVEGEGITPLARRVFDSVCGTYIKARANASVAILDDLIPRVKGALEEKEGDTLEVHYQRIRKGLMDARRIARGIIERTRSLSTLAEGDFARDEIKREQFCLYDAVVQGVQLVEMQPDKPRIVIETVPKVRVSSHRDTVVSVIENITWNAYEAIQGKAGLDPMYKGEAVVIHYDEEKGTLYIANTGPAIPDHRIAEIFSVKTRTAVAKGGLKQATGTGTSMMLKRDMLAALEQKLECYDARTRAALTEKHAILQEYGVNVIFGVEFRS